MKAAMPGSEMMEEMIKLSETIYIPHPFIHTNGIFQSKRASWVAEGKRQGLNRPYVDSDHRLHSSDNWRNTRGPWRPDHSGGSLLLQDPRGSDIIVLQNSNMEGSRGSNFRDLFHSPYEVK